MRCEKCAERRKKAREALLRAATGVKLMIPKKALRVKSKRTSKTAGTAGENALNSLKTEQENQNG